MADFVGLTGKLYADNSCYVPDLEMDIYDMFNPAKNAGLEFQHKIRNGFMLLAEKYPQRIFKINALQDTDRVTAEILRVINTVIKI